MRRLLICACVVYLFSWCCPGITAATKDYYVSTTGSNAKGNGSMAHPWATIAFASAHVRPGATIHVAAGTYTGSFTTRNSGTPSAYITYEADSADFSHPVRCARVTADHGPLSDCVRLIGIRGGTWSNLGNFVTIQGFDVSGPNIGLGRVGIGTYGKATRIIGNSVHDIENFSCGPMGNAGIGPDGADGVVDGNFVYRIGQALCHFTQGIYPNGDSTGTTVIENNVVFEVSSFGIQSWGNTGSDIIVNNTVFNTGDGCIVLGTDTRGQTNANNYVANNICYATRRGVVESGYASSATGKNNIYRNNLFDHVGTIYKLQNGLKAIDTVDAEPLFIRYTGNRTGDYHLQPKSPAVCSGTNHNAPASDFDGVSRPRGQCWSVGAYM